MPFPGTAQIFEGLKVQAFQSNMGPLTGNPCLRAPLASLPWGPPIFITPLQHCAQVCTFTPSFLLVLDLNSGSCGYTTIHHWLSHLLSHNHSTSFWEAFAKSRVCAQVVCNTTRGRYYKKQAELGKRQLSFGRGEALEQGLPEKSVPSWNTRANPRTWRAENLQFWWLSWQMALSISEVKLNSPFTVKGEGKASSFSPLILIFSKHLTSMLRNND